MLRLKANKTALYKLVADYVDNLPPMRSGTLRDLRERGMVEEFVTAAERRRIERSADNGGLSPAT